MIAQESGPFVGRPSVRCWVALLLLVLGGACSSTPDYGDFDDKVGLGAAVGDEILVAGRRFSTGTPVILWTDPGGYNAYSTDHRFRTFSRDGAPRDGDMRLTPGRVARDAEARVLVQPGCTDPKELRPVVDQLVLHYDACGYSQRCFEVLHDLRGLSVHFMLDIDGTIYQTMDLVDQAWHAAEANPRSIGIEIASIGANPVGDTELIDSWYREDTQGLRIVLPAEAGRAGIRVGNFVGRPARPGRQRGLVQGKPFEMYDYTPEQYDALVMLTATLCELFPALKADAPRSDDGRVSWSALSESEYAAYQGILGHYHVNPMKQDPGPAFEWEHFLARVRTRLLVRRPDAQ